MYLNFKLQGYFWNVITLYKNYNIKLKICKFNYDLYIPSDHIIFPAFNLGKIHFIVPAEHYVPAGHFLIPAHHFIVPAEHYVPAHHFLIPAHHFLVPAQFFFQIIIILIYDIRISNTIFEINSANINKPLKYGF